MSYNDLVLEIKRLNPNCDIKISGDSEVYISVNPETLILPSGVKLIFDNGNFSLSVEMVSRINLKPLHTFPLLESDGFSEMVFEKASYENIYELTSKNAKSLILDYLKKLSEVEVTPSFATAIGMSSEGIIKSLCYSGLKKETKFTNSNINTQARNQLYQYINQVANPEIYKEPTEIQEGWESFQSWHITGGSKPDEKTFTHRFYLSISPEKVYVVARMLIEKYNQYGKPYYFKVAKGRATKDSIVVYTSHGTLNTTLQIFRDLEPFMMSISNDVATPHPLTYPLTSWLGYASEIMDGRTSYTDAISESIAIPLKDTLNQFAKSHQNDIVAGISGKEFFSNTDLLTKIERLQIALKYILRDPNSLNDLTNNILKCMKSRGINLQNIYYTDEVVSDLFQYRDIVKGWDVNYNRGYISLKILIIPLVILIGISVALLLRR